jgi:transposase, IS30 family
MSKSYSHLSEADRVTIQSLIALKTSGRAIARLLDVHPSTVCREIQRGKTAPTQCASSYRAKSAHARARARRQRAGLARRKLGDDVKTPLWRTVLSGLRAHWSPEQIAGKLPRMSTPAHDAPAASQDATQASSPHPLSVSHETIYCALYALPRGTLRTELITLLRKSHKSRLPRARGTARKGGPPNMTNIELRPPEVAARIVPGHWEGDLIKGAMNRSSVGTLVERTSRFVILVKLKGGTAADVLDGFKRRLKTLPESLRKTLTYDQGSEMALHETLSAQLNLDIYFCDPHSPWQRGSNENANGLIREFLPKGMDLSRVSHQQLTAIEHALNHRPRKILDFKSPHEVFSKIKLDHIAGVALQA